MADMIKFYRGLVNNLPTTGDNGALYITTDEGAIYYGTGTGMKRLGDFVQVNNVAALPEKAHESCLYYCVAENILAKWNGTEWKQINKQPTAEELKTLLGLGTAAYTDASAYDEAGAADAVRAYVGEIPATATATNIVAYVQEKTAGIATDTALEELTGRVATAEGDIDDIQEALEGKSDEGHKHVKADITDFDHTHTASEITDLDSTIKAYDYATKDEAKGYADAKDDAIAEAKKAGTDAAEALNTYKGEMVTTLAGKQDVIPENTYDAYGASAQALADAQADATTKAGQALTDAKAYVDEEDIFEIDMLTVNAHGGVAAGTDLNGMTTHEILKKILYPYVEPTLGNATASPNGGTYEKGVTKTITSVSIAITKKSEAITSVALYNGSTLIEEKTGDAIKNGGTITFSNVNVEVPTNGNQLTVKVTDAANKTYEKKTSSMTFVYPYYMGSCAAGTAVDEALVESLTKKVESKGNKSNSFTVSDGHMVFAYPKAHGVLKSILDPNNFETIGNYTRSEVSVTGLDGTAQAYYVYVSGATTVSGFTVNFKY